jgi:uncharacterized membrane protein (DUF106 family)
MLHNTLFPIVDIVFYPLFWLPRILSLTLVSVLFGMILLAVYRYTSDQWAMAHYKEKIKSAQLEFFRGNDRWDNFISIARLNGKMAGLGLIPSIACIGLLLIMIPWVGNRFGHQPFEPGTPIEMTVNSQSTWEVRSGSPLRYEPDRGSFESGESTMRLLVEQPGETQLKFLADGKVVDRIELRIAPSTEPIWPTISRPQWYYSIINPAEQQLRTQSPIKRVQLNYTELATFLTFTIPYSSRVPGWLSWFFLISFASGIWAKLHWEIE